LASSLWVASHIMMASVEKRFRSITKRAGVW